MANKLDRRQKIKIFHIETSQHKNRKTGRATF
jgi:hypothetical protein